MFTFRDFIIFLAGAQFFHTLSHIVIVYSIKLPLKMKFMTLTSKINTWAIIANAVITAILLWWATSL